MLPYLSCVDKNNKSWLQRPLTDRKTTVRLIVYSLSSTNPDNVTKIGPVDFEIIGLTEVVTNKDETEAERTGLVRRACCRTAAGRAK